MCATDSIIKWPKINKTDKEPLYVHLHKCKNQANNDPKQLHEHFVNNYKFKYSTKFWQKVTSSINLHNFTQ